MHNIVYNYGVKYLGVEGAFGESHVDEVRH
jgi:hypothetical protein